MSELVLTGVATGSNAEAALLTRELGRIFPEAFERFVGELPPTERDGNLAAACNRLTESPDPAHGVRPHRHARLRQRPLGPGTTPGRRG
ncbi:putative proline iminopeptidase [Streptomyces viridochromogenes Tue57]|uniref:Putative proline iminopeptidase n=1 Tax=Streptomyces viridochromogenes Tue57 TaxID=1160705 RepID=L8P7P6_STRVR|nr:putative proline iminopeptidase [Streptomyces viridochromogenes Tue57]